MISKIKNGPIFIVGSSRSGTTMLSRIIGRNDDVYSFKELHFFEKIFDGQLNKHHGDMHHIVERLLNIQKNGIFTKDKDQNYREDAIKLVKENECELFQASDAYKCFLYATANKNNASYPCDHTPRNVFFINEITTLFPNSKIINMVRDPRDVMTSQKHKWMRRNLGASKIPRFEMIRAFLNYHPLTIAKLWKASISEYLKSQENKSVMLVKYEDLLSEPSIIVKDICDFIGIKYSDDMLNVPYAGSSVQTDENMCGIDNSRINRWKNGYLKDYEIMLSQLYLSKHIKFFGYEFKDDLKVNYIQLMLSVIILPFQLFLAILINVKNSKNIFKSIIRRL